MWLAWPSVSVALKLAKPSTTSYLLMNPAFGLSAMEGSASARKECLPNWNPRRNTHIRFMCGVAFPIGVHLIFWFLQESWRRNSMSKVFFRIPFCRLLTTFPDGYRFQQDNDPKRKSKTLKFPNLFLMRLPGKFLCMFVTFRSSSYAVYSR